MAKQIDILMEQIKQEAPLLMDFINKNEQYSINEYLETLDHHTGEGIEALEDVKDAVIEYLDPLIGTVLAEEAAKQVIDQRLLLTANHHEVEYCVQSLQGNFIYERMLCKKGFHKGIVPIFSNTTVSMSNSNFPRGMLIYDTIKKEDIVKIPIFPFKQRNSMVAAAKPFTKEMILNSTKTLAREYHAQNIKKSTYNMGMSILSDYYLKDEVLLCKRYGEQVALLNQNLGHSLYSDQKAEFIYIEMEAVSSSIIIRNLDKRTGLGYNILFDLELRNYLMKYLDQKTGCWDTASLKTLGDKNFSSTSKMPIGTHFFWGVDERQRRFSFFLEHSCLVGRDMGGKEYKYEFEPDIISGLLNERKIIPCLFLTFFELYMTRDFTILGGCFQGDYLKGMQAGIIKALKQIGGHEMEIAFLEKKQSFYLSGPMFLVGKEKESIYPMSTVEIFEKGGISVKDINTRMNISMHEAHEIGIFNFYMDLIRKQEQIPNWWNTLCSQRRRI